MCGEGRRTARTLLKGGLQVEEDRRLALTGRESYMTAPTDTGAVLTDSCVTDCAFHQPSHSLLYCVSQCGPTHSILTRGYRLGRYCDRVCDR